MPSTVIHIAIAKKYCKKYPNINTQEFHKGNLQPDLEENKYQSHYSKYANIQDPTESAKRKVDIKGYVAENNINNDYDLGRFMHILTDFYFYGEFLVSRDNFKNSKNNLKEIIATLFDDYSKLNNYLSKHFNINLENLSNIDGRILHGKPKLIQYQDIIDFIEHCASLNLQETYARIIASS